MSKTIRCCRTALLVAAAILVVTGSAFAQHTTGLPTTKTCPPTAASGSTYECSFLVTNADDQHGVANLAVTEESPIGGTPAPIECLQPACSASPCTGTAVTSLGLAGSGTASCGNIITVTALQNCSGVNQFNSDEINASGTDADPGDFNGLPVSGSAPNQTVVPPLVCDDGLFCTDDSCDPAVGCVAPPHPCPSDGLACNGAETCDEAADACVSGPPIVCGDDGNACNGPEACEELTGVCVSGPPLVCDDGLFCTDDSCDAAAGCQTTAHVCSDDDICTVDTCNEETDVCDFALDPTIPGCSESLPGRMTGGGSIFTQAGGRVTHGFELHCDPEVGPNNLEINWGGGNHFHLTELQSATCTDDPSIAPRPPSADFDTYVGTGTGTCNGVEGATITFTMTDAGEPGKKDFATFEITGCPDGLTLSVSGNLNKGNQQAHKN